MDRPVGGRTGAPRSRFTGAWPARGLQRPRWQLSLAIEEPAGAALFRRISRALVEEIQRGRLAPGTRLPGSRTLARLLRVNRNTVLAAYEELASEGWTEPLRASGTFVSHALPERRPLESAARARRRQVPAHTGFELHKPVFVEETQPPAGALQLSAGVPDVRLLSTTQLGRALRRAVRHEPAANLGYGNPHGHPRLRAALAAMLSATRGIAARPEDIVVTSGSQMALDLVARALLRPGDAVAVEYLGYPRAWSALRQHGARLLPIGVDQAGIDVTALAALARRTPVRAVYLTPHHQYPTTVTLSAARRVALLELARELRIALIEDDYDHEYHYDGRPVLPLASADDSGVVIYVGSLAKVLAPGVRLGYVAAPRELADIIAMHRCSLDRQGNHIVEAAAADLLEQGEVQRHARRATRIYRARRDLCAQTLRRELGAALSFQVPAGGLTLWARVADDIDAQAWASRARERGLIVHTGRHFTVDARACPHLRLGFAPFNEQELVTAIRRLRRAL